MVIWQEKDPDLSELLGPPPLKGGMWYSLILTPVMLRCHCKWLMR